MQIRTGCSGIALILPLLLPSLCSARYDDQRRPWKGYSILGNGHLTAVYSDDSRITALTHAKGIQHFYYKDYAADYVASTSFELATFPAPGNPRIGMKNFFTAKTTNVTTHNSSTQLLCFVHPGDAVVLSLSDDGAVASEPYRFVAELRKEIKTDTTINLTALNEVDHVMIATWSNGAVLAVAAKNPNDTFTVTNSTVSVTGNLGGRNSKAEMWLVPADSQAEALARVRSLRQEKDVETTAAAHWNSWMKSGILPRFYTSTPESAAYLEAYKRNLYCVKAADLNGQIPADITGQFVTNNMPQLYPRDAMMCARVLLLTGHADEAKQVIEFWANPRIPMKTPGEWYARYDAHGKPVDAGTGARFDEPEWDANGYYIYLLVKYHDAKGVWLGDRSLFYQLADFLVRHIGRDGLLEEGGIVEWTGYLPATNMICSAALQTAARLSREFGDEARARTYSDASRRIASSLPAMFDRSRQTYADVRFTDRKGANGESLPGQTGERTFLWDTTANVGVIWGYPNHREIESSNLFYRKTTIKLDGGMQYFDSPDPGLAAYGHAIFFFTTAAAAQYEALRGDKAAAKGFIDWMMRNANSYGLMPERINLDGSDSSPATPLSWCSAEFAAALLAWRR